MRVKQLVSYEELVYSALWRLEEMMADRVCSLISARLSSSSRLGVASTHSAPSPESTLQCTDTNKQTNKQRVCEQIQRLRLRGGAWEQGSTVYIASYFREF